MELDEILKLLNKHANSSKKLPELAFIGAVSQFEAFWKDSFGSLINIAPQLIGNLEKAGIDVRIRPEVALTLGDTIWHSFGFILAEKMDFGSAHKINSVFSKLLNISPFSAKEKTEYDSILADRNLLVHHGGIYTNSYLNQKLLSQNITDRPHIDSLVLDQSQVVPVITFFKGLAFKFITSSKSVVEEKIASGSLEIDNSGSEALSLYSWWDADG